MAKFYNVFPILMLSEAFNCAAAATFHCGSLSVADCKETFGKQLEEEIFRFSFASHVDLLIRKIHSYKRVMETLPENDEHLGILEQMINRLHERLYTLNMNTFNTPEGWINLRKSTDNLEIDVNSLYINDNSEGIVQRIFKENNNEGEERTFRDLMQYDLIERTLETWTRLYAGLRTIDFWTFPDYRYLNKAFEIVKGDKSLRVKHSDFMLAMKKAGKFFGIGLFEMLF